MGAEEDLAVVGAIPHQRVERPRVDCARLRVDVDHPAPRAPRHPRQFDAVLELDAIPAVLLVRRAVGVREVVGEHHEVGPELRPADLRGGRGGRVERGVLVLEALQARGGQDEQVAVVGKGGSGRPDEEAGAAEAARQPGVRFWRNAQRVVGFAARSDGQAARRVSRCRMGCHWGWVWA